MEDITDWAIALARGAKRSARYRTQRLGLALGLLCCCYSMHSVAQPAAPAEIMQPGERVSEQQAASRAMLEFLSQFSELDDAEFELLTTFAERDANPEPQESADE